MHIVKSFKLSLIMSIGLIGLSGCTGKQNASHVPPLWQWPTAAIGTAIGNGVYDVRRNRTKRYLTKHYHVVRDSVMADRFWAILSPHFLDACDVARVNSANCSKLRHQLRQDKHLYFTEKPNELPSAEQIENLTIAFMVHGK